MPRLKIAAKFFLVLATIAPLMLVLAWAGLHGLKAIDQQLVILDDNVRGGRITTDLGRRLANAEAIALRLSRESDPRARSRLERRLDVVVAPAVFRGLSDLAEVDRKDSGGETAAARSIRTGWQRFLALRSSGALDPRKRSGARRRAATGEEIASIIEPLIAATGARARVEEGHARVAKAAVDRSYSTSRTLIVTTALVALLVGAGSMIAIIRDIVPRVRRYSRFAADVAAGQLDDPLDPRGDDELAELGRALNEMVAGRAAEERHDGSQAEFVDSLQVTENEEEAHDLLKRQLERSISGSEVVVLNRNNSADRLEATTAVPLGSPLDVSLDGAKPRSCLAVRFGRAHEDGADRTPLMRCEVCGKSARDVTCEPLLVGGEVIGSVLVEHGGELTQYEAASITESVSQAAPVLANLRNLAIAELRASTDALTGLANNRAVRDTVKRVVAHASRSLSPVSAILLDLDHFKQINDTFGHARGDDVLSAVGAALVSSVRESDFVGRYGGEEFIILLPDTPREQALHVAENIRATVARITVPGVERAITASLGVASLPEDAGDAQTLVRNADRALYTAKRNGRDRVESAEGQDQEARAGGAIRGEARDSGEAHSEPPDPAGRSVESKSRPGAPGPIIMP